MNKKKWLRRRRRLFGIVEVGHDLDFISRSYDFFTTFMIVLHLIVSIMYTFDALRASYGAILLGIEHITVATFAIDYFLRIFTARFLYEDEENMTEAKAIGKYMFSFMGLVDLLSWLPYFLPVFFLSGTVAFRMIRIVRIFRLFRINAYYDSLHVITQVLYGKRQQLISSVVLISILMIGASLCMYSLEHEAQPEVFQNAFSGIWWASSTLLTIGYGDIYPVTTMGKVLGIVISFLGVGMVAIPTGIISAGFVDMYATIKQRNEYGYVSDMQFIKTKIEEDDKWIGKRIADLAFPSGLMVAFIKREEEVLIPRGDVVIEKDDMVVLGAIPHKELAKEHISLKEIVLKEQNPWVGVRIKDLDISRQAVIVMVKRRNKSLLPHGKMMLEAGDRVFLYTKLHLAEAETIDF